MLRHSDEEKQEYIHARTGARGPGPSGSGIVGTLAHDGSNLSLLHRGTHQTEEPARAGLDVSVSAALWKVIGAALSSSVGEGRSSHLFI